MMKPLLKSRSDAGAVSIPPFDVMRGDPVTAPVLFASPHSGSHYPDELQSAMQVPLLDLRRTEDAFVDELFASVASLGMVQINALYGRCYVDLNRDSRELDADMFEDGLPRVSGLPSARVRAGLGCLPKVAASGKAIYRSLLRREEAERRLTQIHDRYHAQVVAEIGTLQETWPHVFMIDCHSMPSVQPGRPELPDFVLGDRFGSSCHSRLTGLLERELRTRSYSVARNAPYAGGYTTRRFGRPKRGVHVLQIEINRGLYMNEMDVELAAGFERLRQNLTEIIQVISDFAREEHA